MSLVGPRHEVTHLGLHRPPVAKASVKNVFEMTHPILDLLLAGWSTGLVTSVGVTHEEAPGTQKCLHAWIGVRGCCREIGRDHALHEEGGLGVVRSLADLVLRNHGFDCGSNSLRNRYVGCLGRLFSACDLSIQASSPPGLRKLFNSFGLPGRVG